MADVYDRYSQEVERLTEHPDLIQHSWELSQPLFQWCDSGMHLRPDGERCGCLTMVRGKSIFGNKAWTDELTAAILCDERIPQEVAHITVRDLPVFAEWQRRLDRELGRTPPPLLPVEPTSHTTSTGAP